MIFLIMVKEVISKLFKICLHWGSKEVSVFKYLIFLYCFKFFNTLLYTYLRIWYICLWWTLNVIIFCNVFSEEIYIVLHYCIISQKIGSKIDDRYFEGHFTDAQLCWRIIKRHRTNLFCNLMKLKAVEEYDISKDEVIG